MEVTVMCLEERMPYVTGKGCKIIEQEKNCTGHIHSKSPWRYSATNNTAWEGRGTHLILRGTSFGLSSSWVPCSFLTGWEMLTHCLPAHQGWVSSDSQHSPVCVVCVVCVVRARGNWRAVSQDCHPWQGWASRLCGDFLLLPLIQSFPPDGEVGEGSGEGDLWRVSEHLYVTAVKGRGKGRTDTWETSGSWTRMGGRCGLKQEARLEE